MERAVQTGEQYMRAPKSQLDNRHGARIDTRHPILTWLCDKSMDLLNRMEVSKDGKTANGICEGKHAKVLGNKFGEQVLRKNRQVGTHQSKLHARWVYGLFVGVKLV